MTMIKRKDGSYSKRGLWDNIRANKGSGKKPTKEMLKQEKKINNKNKEGGMLKKKRMYKAGGAKPDYLDFDKDGNKNESMKSALKSKKKMKKGGMGKKSKKAKIPMRYQGGGFLEPGIENIDNL